MGIATREEKYAWELWMQFPFGTKGNERVLTELVRLRQEDEALLDRMRQRAASKEE